VSGTRSAVKTKPAGPTLSVTKPTLDRFEKRRRAQRRRRWMTVAGVALLVAAMAVGVWAVAFSRWFGVSKVVVVGTHRLTVAQVEQAAHVPAGRPIVRVDTAAIRRHVAAIPELASVVVTTQWPHTVTITVVERQPAAVAAVPDGFRLLDPSGVDLGQVAQRPASLPLLAIDPTTGDHAALAAAASVAAWLTPGLKAKVASISALTANSVVLDLKSGATVRWGDASQGAIKAEVLAALMKRPAAVYDVSAPYAPTTARN
jgi:cell division protein FtsQ